jgi:hypothetical protein
MKTKEQLALHYALKKSAFYLMTDDDVPLTEEVNEAFLAGYEAAQPKWVKVEDGLPPVDKQVCVFTKSGETIIGYLDSDNVWTMSETGYIRTVISWCDCIPTFKSETV